MYPAAPAFLPEEGAGHSANLIYSGSIVTCICVCVCVVMKRGEYYLLPEYYLSTEKKPLCL